MSVDGVSVCVSLTEDHKKKKLEALRNRRLGSLTKGVTQSRLKSIEWTL